jgi:hypothetical protein
VVGASPSKTVRSTNTDTQFMRTATSEWPYDIVAEKSPYTRSLNTNAAKASPGNAFDSGPPVTAPMLLQPCPKPLAPLAWQVRDSMRPLDWYPTCPKTDVFEWVLDRRLLCHYRSLDNWTVTLQRALAQIPCDICDAMSLGWRRPADGATVAVTLIWNRRCGT